MSEITTRRARTTRRGRVGERKSTRRVVRIGTQQIHWPKLRLLTESLTLRFPQSGSDQSVDAPFRRCESASHTSSAVECVALAQRRRDGYGESRLTKSLQETAAAPCS